jgi:hypothetical protein
MAVGETLTVIPKPGATPLVRNAASAIAFYADYYKLNEPNISMRERMAIAIVGLTHVVTSPDYRTNHAGLIQDAAVYTGGISAKFDLFSALAGIDWTNGKLVDAALSADMPTLLKEGRDLANLSEDELNRIYILLRAQLLS